MRNRDIYIFEIYEIVPIWPIPVLWKVAPGKNPAKHTRIPRPFYIFPLSPCLHEGNNNACTVPYQAFHKFLPSLEVSPALLYFLAPRRYRFTVHLLPSIVLENTRSVLVMKEISVCRLFRVSLQRAHRSLSLYSGGDRWRLIATVSIYKFQKNVAGKESSLLRPRMKIRSRVIEHCCDSVTSRVVLSLAYIFTGKKSCSIRFVYKKLTRYVFFILSKNPRKK